jgi:hypothetical protein
MNGSKCLQKCDAAFPASPVLVPKLNGTLFAVYCKKYQAQVIYD